MRRMPTDEELKQIALNTEAIEALEEGKINSYEATNLTTLSKDFINNLKAGDVVLKKTGTSPNYSYHSYRVSFKKNNEGICLTYTDAGYMETVSYDKSGTNWVYNSTDVVNVNRLEQIVDKDGHERFIEGNITPSTITDVSFSYSKWSLSGTHLMIVIAGSISEVSIASGTQLALVALPDWIMNKIYPLKSPSTIVSFSTMTARSTEYSTYTYSCYIEKRTEGIVLYNKDVINDGLKDVGFRLQFDLLIDNE